MGSPSISRELGKSIEAPVLLEDRSFAVFGRAVKDSSAAASFPTDRHLLFRAARTQRWAGDARIIGWLSWKMRVSGFEYWSANSWGQNLRKPDEKPFLAQIETNWKANTFGEYNGDGYLVYPGPDGSVLSSIRLENLRHGIEDYEMLALLRDCVTRAKANGTDVEAAEKLLAIDDTICRSDLTYTSNPQTLLTARRRVAECLQRLRQVEALGR
jgi:hypothetical protein